MNKLKDFPLVREAIQNIFLDSGGHTAITKVNKEAEIPERWLRCFRAVETTFSDIDRRYERLMSLGWRLKGEDWWGEVHITPTTRTLYWVWLPINDSNIDILRACGCGDAQIYCVEHLLEEYFQGELKDVLEMKI